MVERVNKAKEIGGSLIEMPGLGRMAGDGRCAMCDCLMPAGALCVEIDRGRYACSASCLDAVHGPIADAADLRRQAEAAEIEAEDLHDEAEELERQASRAEARADVLRAKADRMERMSGTDRLALARQAQREGSGLIGGER